MARLAGAEVPKDRIIDGVDQTDFFLGKQEKSNREGFVVYVGTTCYGVKWRNWKMMPKEMERGYGPVRSYGCRRFFNLLTDPKEEHPPSPAAENLWVRFRRQGAYRPHGHAQAGAADQAGHPRPLRRKR